MTIELPAPIIGYLSADSAADRDASLRHFNKDAVITDEGKTYVGLDGDKIARLGIGLWRRFLTLRQR